jgi:probable F420-dependent oxidoreductase
MTDETTPAAARSEIEFGAYFPSTEIGNDPAAIKHWAQGVEEMGFGYAAIVDHVLGAVHADREPALWAPYNETHPFHEPMVLMGFLAAVTEHLNFQTNVVILPQRQIALLAKQAAEIDVLSAGRLRLGVGSGWNYVEYEALGVPWEDRGSRMDEQIELLRQLWTEPVVDFHGTFHRVDRAGILPRPKQPIPLWFGGFADIALRRAARLGDGFVFTSSDRAAAETLDRLRGHLVEAGRDIDSFPIEFALAYGSGPERWERAMQRITEHGVSHVTVNTMSTGADFYGTSAPNLTSVDDHLSALETFLAAVKA